MALVDCLECKGSISSEAPACPHCGAPNSVLKSEKLEEDKARFAIGNVGISLAAIVFSVLIPPVGIALVLYFLWRFLFKKPHA